MQHDAGQKHGWIPSWLTQPFSALLMVNFTGALGYSIVMPVLGRWSDRIGRRRMLGLFLGGLMYPHFGDWLFALSAGLIFAVIVLTPWFPREQPVSRNNKSHT